MPGHFCCEMHVMQCMTYFFCASLQSCWRIYQWGLTPPLILICYSPPTEVGVISHLIYLLSTEYFCVESGYILSDFLESLYYLLFFLISVNQYARLDKYLIFLSYLVYNINKMQDLILKTTFIIVRIVFKPKNNDA